MPIDEKLLEILCCPKTKVPVKLLPSDRLEKLNDKVKQGGVKNKGSEPVDKPAEEALITEDGKTIYIIQDGIPIMLEDQGIPTEQLSGFND